MLHIGTVLLTGFELVCMMTCILSFHFNVGVQKGVQQRYNLSS